MKHISKLILNNFQQWKTGLIEFKPGLNILVGNTESGKSTLFRAINSILTGKMPEDYIRKGTKGCEVEIQFSDNTIFKRIRNKKDNVVNANGIIFERIGKEIPFEYFNKLGNTTIKFGNKELSLCNYSQFEPHFFITLSDYDKSKLIGTICGIDIVDKLVDGINKDIRSNNSNIKFLTEQIEKHKSEKELKEDEFNKKQEIVSNMQTLLEDIQNKFKTLETLSNLNSKRLLLQSDIIYIEQQKNALKLKIDEFNKDKVEQLNTLYQLKIRLNKLQVEILDIEQQKQSLKVDNKINFDKAILLDDLVFLREKLTTYKNNIANINQDLMQVNEKLKYLQIEKQTLLDGYNKCPLCGGIL